jgi:hypothetical protein
VTTEELFARLDILGIDWPEGMPVGELERLLEDVPLSPIAKHTPGGHDHDQSTHGRRGPRSWSLRKPLPGQTTLFDSDPDSDSDPLPLPPARRVHINYALARILRADRERIVRDLNAAVDAFDAFYPGALPDEISVDVMTDWQYANSGEAYAFVNPSNLDIASTVSVWERFGDDDEIINAHQGSGFAYTKFKSAEPGEMRQAIFFHELAHVAVATRGWGLNYDSANWPSHYPSYNGRWYTNSLPGSDPLLPSEYAIFSAPEFFAEALTDVWANGDKAAPLSKLTARMFRKELDQERDR